MKLKTKKDRLYDEAQMWLDYTLAWTSLKQQVGGLTEEDRARAKKELEISDSLIREAHATPDSSWTDFGGWFKTREARMVDEAGARIAFIKAWSEVKRKMSDLSAADRDFINDELDGAFKLLEKSRRETYLNR